MRIGAAGLAAALLLVLIFAQGREALASGVSATGIRSIRTGMSEQDVNRIRGDPIDREDDTALHERTLLYAKPVRGARWYPMLWIHLRDGRVSVVYGKKSIWWRIDDEGVYLLDESGHSENPYFEETFSR
jgi:hypothetical protein